MRNYLIVGTLVASLLSGCDQIETEATSKVEISVITAAVNASGSHAKLYKDEDIYDYSVQSGTIYITLKDGSHVSASNFVITTKGDK